MIGKLVGGNREEIGLQLAAIVEMRQTVKKTYEGFLHDVFAGRTVVDPALHEGEQPAFIALDEVFPGAWVALPNLPNEQPIAFGRHRLFRLRPVDDFFIIVHLTGPAIGNNAQRLWQASRRKPDESSSWLTPIVCMQTRRAYASTLASRLSSYARNHRLVAAAPMKPTAVRRSQVV